MLLLVLFIWLMVFGIRVGFRVLSFAGRIILGLLGVFVLLSLIGIAGAALFFFVIPALGLAFLI